MPVEEGHAFDARKIWMSESGQDLQQWRLVSLVTALRAALLEGPAGDGDGPVSQACPDSERRLSFLHAVMDELTDRGLDADSLVRYGLLPEVIAPVLETLVVTQLLGAEAASVFERDRSVIDVEGWRRAFGLSGDRAAAFGRILEDPGELEATVKRVIYEAIYDVASVLGPVVGWIFATPIDDVLTLRSPSSEELESVLLSGTTVGPEILADYRWIVDRFSTTFFGQWATESLHSEYRWAQGLVTPPCSVTLMQERPIELPELEPEIARRTVHDTTRGQTGDRLAAQVQNHAKSFLMEGRSREAAALFEFVCREQPENAEALNNLGFCLIPDSPKVALQYLERANRLGYAPRVINVYNRMCCHIAAGRPRVAIREAERYWEEAPEPTAVAATLWVPEANVAWALRGVRSARDQLAKLAAHAVELDENRRSSRLDHIRDEPSSDGD